MMKTLLVNVHKDREALRRSIDSLKNCMPKPLAASFQHPDKTQAIGQHVSRFSASGVSDGGRS